MNLFRSEEHVRSWSLYDPAAREGTLSLQDWVHVFSTGYCRKRLEPDYFLKARDLRPGIPQALAQLGKVGRFWGAPSTGSYCKWPRLPLSLGNDFGGCAGWACRMLHATGDSGLTTHRTDPERPEVRWREYHAARQCVSRNTTRSHNRAERRRNVNAANGRRGRDRPIVKERN